MMKKFIFLIPVLLSGCMTISAFQAKGNEMLKAKTLSVSIQNTPETVYEFVSHPENLPLWATTFVHSIKQENGEWIIETDKGPAKIRVAEKNILGILDHTVYPAPGVEVFVPMRVVKNGGGCEVLFTLFQQPLMSEEAFASDTRMVEQDLLTLKTLMEQR